MKTQDLLLVALVIGGLYVLTRKKKGGVAKASSQGGSGSGGGGGAIGGIVPSNVETSETAIDLIVNDTKPSMTQCIKNPDLAGCESVLPELANKDVLDETIAGLGDAGGFDLPYDEVNPSKGTGIDTQNPVSEPVSGSTSATYVDTSPVEAPSEITKSPSNENVVTEVTNVLTEVPTKGKLTPEQIKEITVEVPLELGEGEVIRTMEGVTIDESGRFALGTAKGEVNEDVTREEDVTNVRAVTESTSSTALPVQAKVERVSAERVSNFSSDRMDVPYAEEISMQRRKGRKDKFDFDGEYGTFMDSF